MINPTNPSWFRRLFPRRAVEAAPPPFFTVNKPYVTGESPLLWQQAEVNFSALYAIVTTWCINHRYLVPIDPGTEGLNSYIPAVRPLDTDVPSLIYGIEFRQLCYSHQLARFVNFIVDGTMEKPTTDLINLCLELSIRERHLAELYLNRLYVTISAFDADADGEVVDDLDPAVQREALGTKLSWAEVHTQCPFLWVVFCVQQILREAADPFEE